MKRPTDALSQMQALSQRMREAMALQRRRRTARPSLWQPPMDLRATEQEYIITIDVPGVTRDGIEATAEDGLVRVRGSVELPEAIREARRVRSERKMGRFARSIRLPSDADTSNISATLAEGVLEVRVGRRRGSGRITIRIEE